MSPQMSEFRAWEYPRIRSEWYNVPSELGNTPDRATGNRQFPRRHHTNPDPEFVPAHNAHTKFAKALR
jgi:hypothetical protein